MNTQTDNTSAFPSEQHECADGTWNQTYDSGMSLRDYFAAKAMHAYMRASLSNEAPKDASLLASWAYQMADEMMAVRKENA